MENMALVPQRSLGSGKFQKFVKNEGGSTSKKSKRLEEVRSRESILEEISTLKLQDVGFFVKERSLSNKGLDPKNSKEVDPYATLVAIEEIFGKGGKFRTTNTQLHPDTWKELIDLYKKIYGTRDVTNNEFMEWHVKGYIAELSGEQVNWAEAAAATARWKLDHIHRVLLKMDAEGSGKRGDGMWISGSSGSLQPSGLNGRLFGAKEGRQRSSGCRLGDPSEFVVLL
jgi:hypothetical protein